MARMAQLALMVLGLTAVGSLPALAANDGVWSELAPPGGRAYHTVIHDAVRHRLLAFGGLGPTRYNDVWALPLDGPGTWQLVPTAGTPPAPRNSHAAIYDPARDRMLVMGGYDGANIRNDVWALSLAGTPTWTPIAPLPSPPSPRQLHRAIYDPVRDRMVIFGGHDGSSRNDVWALTLSGAPSWTELAPGGVPPAARSGAAVAYDAARDRLLVFGGATLGTRFDDAWALSLAGSPTWSEILPSGERPPARELTGGVYDPGSDRLIVFGGYGSTGGLNDAWALALSGTPAWSELVAPGGPAGLWAFAPVHDPLSARLLVHGGGGNGFQSHLWALELDGPAQWDLVSPLGRPSDRSGHVAVRDPVRDRMLVLGGATNEAMLFNDTWAYDLSAQAWALVSAGDPPPARRRHGAVYDPVRDRVIVFGGVGASGLLGDVWSLDLSGPPTWTPLTPSGTPPSPRQGHTMIYDPPRNRVVVFGGLDATGHKNDVWSLSLSNPPAWTPIATSGPPPPRAGHGAVYDGVRDRMVVFGGEVFFENGDTWELPLGASPTWRFMTTGPGRFHFALVHDAPRDRMVMFGGQLYDVLGLSATFALDLEQEVWTELEPGAPDPGPRYDHAGIYDPARDRMVVFGGGTGDVWALRWSGLLGVGGPGTSAREHLSLEIPFPNPARHEVALRFSLPRTGAMRLTIVDLAGRVVRRLVDGARAAGAHSEPWDGRDGHARPAAPGVYLAVLQLGDSFAVRRLVKLD